MQGLAALDPDSKETPMSNFNRLALALSLAVLPLAAQGVPTRPQEEAPETPKKVSALVSVYIKDDKGAPIEDVAVTVDDHEAMILTRGETDAAGNARLVVIHAGDAWVRILKPGYTPDQKKITVTAGPKPIEVSFVMKKAKM
jgi:hypothetical protein